MDSNKPALNFLNARRGFATNSSSSHSMLLLSNKDQSISDDHDNSFGWDYFTLSKSDSKKKYLASLIAHSLKLNFGFNISMQILQDLGLVENEKEIGDLPSIDHQSVFEMPLTSDMSSSNILFIKEFVNWALRPDVVILGGNDNDDINHPLHSQGLDLSIRSWMRGSNLVAHKDEENNTWSLFSKENGLTLRFSFDDMASAQNQYEKYIENTYGKSNSSMDRPNLVDIKITDSCPYKCEYCYQSSTPTAPHAPVSKIISIAQSLATKGVFEVALGGGETTLHPDFNFIVNEFDKRGITPNVTTRNLTWVKNPSSLEVMSKIGAFAISVDNVQGVKKALKAVSKMRDNISEFNEKGKHDMIEKLSFSRPCFQIVVGTQSKEEFKQMIEEIWRDNLSHSITLLGYKDVGFGEDYIKNPTFEKQINHANENWIDWIKDINNKIKEEMKNNGVKYVSPNFWISVDTALAKTSEEKLKINAENKAKNMYHTVEGSQSMYIDAVTNKMAPSSFAHPSESVDFDENDWLEKFKSFSKPKKSKKIGLKLK